jgi:spermidine synthase
MRKHGGTLIHCSRDDYGLAEIVETHGVRSLHFGTNARQSAMALDEPDRLELPYLRAMLAGLLFAPEPRRVLLLGLGGGSLAKFLLQHFAGCRIETVEARVLVEDLARRYFGLPEDPRLRVSIDDGHDFLCGQPASCYGSYDCIFVDIFDAAGVAAAIHRHDFFAAGARLLAPAGVFAVNLWSSHPESLRQAMRMLNLYFDGGTMRLQVVGRGNVIGFGFGPEIPKPDRASLEQRARALELRVGIEFSRLLEQLYAQRPR